MQGLLVFGIIVRNVSTKETNILYIKITKAISYQLNQATQPQFDNSINSI